jgi:hypothetical protein
MNLSSLPRAKRFELMKQMGLMKGNRHDRKIEKYSNNFNEIFNFFLNSYRKGLLTFGTEAVIIKFDKEGRSGKDIFRRFEDGQFRDKPITSRHNNIVHSVIVAKKSWGLFVNEWAMGIAESSFMKEEIIKTFEDKGIKIPSSLFKDFENRMYSERVKYIRTIFQH